MILFGSLARDEVTADSDVDLLVVFDRPIDALDLMTDLRVSLVDVPVSMDLLPIASEKLAQVREVYYAALREGQTVYERRRRRDSASVT